MDSEKDRYVAIYCGENPCATIQDITYATYLGRKLAEKGLGIVFGGTNT